MGPALSRVLINVVSYQSTKVPSKGFTTFKSGDELDFHCNAGRQAGNAHRGPRVPP